MSIEDLHKEIMALSERERDELLARILVEPKLREELDRVGYLRLSERAFDFWNDPREDIYQDYANKK